MLAGRTHCQHIPRYGHQVYISGIVRLHQLMSTPFYDIGSDHRRLYRYMHSFNLLKRLDVYP